MALILDVKTLLPAVHFMKAFVSDRAIIPAYQHFFFTPEALEAYMGTAGAFYAGLWPKKAIPEPFSLPAESLVKILASLGDQGVGTVEFGEAKNGRVQVKGGRFKSGLPILTGDALNLNLPDPPGDEAQVSVSGGFWDDVERMLFSVCQDETKPVLRGLFVAPSGTLVATDSFRISVLSPGPESFKPRAGVLLPDYLLTRLGAQRKQVQALTVRESQCWFFLESAQVFGALLEGAFPASRVGAALKGVREQAKVGGTWILLDPDATLDLLLARLLYFAEPPTFSVQVTVETKSVTLRAGGSDGAPGAEEVIPAKIQGPGGTFAINGRYLREACQVSNRFWFQSPHPLYFLSPDKRLEHLVILLAQ